MRFGRIVVSDRRVGLEQIKTSHQPLFVGKQSSVPGLFHDLVLNRKIFLKLNELIPNPP